MTTRTNAIPTPTIVSIPVSRPDDVGSVVVEVLCDVGVVSVVVSVVVVVVVAVLVIRTSICEIK